MVHSQCAAGTFEPKDTREALSDTMAMHETWVSEGYYTGELACEGRFGMSELFDLARKEACRSEARAD